ncbi:ADP-ribose pyrophosphatase, mitochondrial isoform X2 [Pseudophryne corroboree]|uniref:ADP-ribose pyrophosphatase, mitochondrial isoform X2 n=1 Tax=Pseudophryne corroboree TaxID=495146 RepID=UPI0030819EAB
MVSRTLTRVLSTASVAAGLAVLASLVVAYWYRKRSRQPAMATHIKALTSPYPGSRVERWPVPPEKVSWSVDWPEYQPVQYTAPSVLGLPPWADPSQSNNAFRPQYNTLDGPVDRTSFEGTYHVENRTPRNPRGRTGVIGRGLLGRWGPNHAADPIITRWKRDDTGKKVTHVESGKPILQFVAIQRKDCGQWAIPGGMVDPGERVSATLRREFCEEALNSLESTEEEKDTEEKIHRLFSQEHVPIYSGYVDDPRNTDNAWMETLAVNFHDETGNMLEQVTLQAGDDAGSVRWVDMTGSCSLYASHAHFIQIVAGKRGAHW